MTIFDIMSKKQIKELVKKEVQIRVKPLETQIDKLRNLVNDLERIIK